MSESADRTLRMIGQLTDNKTDHFSKWGKISGKIAIVCSESSIKQVNSRFALAMSINCLARVDPIVTDLNVVILHDVAYEIGVPLFDGKDVKSGIISFIQKLKPKVNVNVINKLEDNYDAVLSIGNTSHIHSYKISIASDGWLTLVSPTNLSNDFTDNINPVGAYAAANLGCIEVFKKVFVKKADLIVPNKSEYDFRWKVRFLSQEFIFNTFDYSIDRKDSANPYLPKEIHVNELTVAGIGAGGGACLYTLASLPALKGTFHLVDPDEVKDSNLNRYVYSIRSDAVDKKPKVHVMEQILSRHKQCIIHPNPASYTEFSKQLNSKPIEFLISTVDTGKTRTDIQWDLPKVILDAGVMQTEFHVHRIEFGKKACLGCRFWPDGSSDSIENRLSKITGLSPLLITELRANNAQIEKSHIETMKSFSEKYNFPLPKPGDRFQDWFLHHCGELQINNQSIPIPVPFASVMPGILLAGEVIKQRHFNASTSQDYFSFDIFGISTNPQNTIEKKNDCPICSNKLTLKRYKEKHNIQDQD